MEENTFLSEMLRDISYDVSESGRIFGNRHIIVGKFITNGGNKMIVFFDLFNENIEIETIEYFCSLTKDMDSRFTKDIINIEYANNERED